jgi:hypothetical protein
MGGHKDKERKRAYDREYYQRTYSLSGERYEQRRTHDREYYRRMYSPSGERYEQFKERKRKRDKSWYQRNKERIQEKRKQKRYAIMAWYRQYKVTLKCIRCGENEPSCLHFHHRTRAEKKMSIATYVAQVSSIDKLLQEIEKCDILCANCHLIEHWQDMYETHLLEHTKLKQQLADTRGWFERKKIRRSLAQLEAKLWLSEYKRTLTCHSCGQNHPARLHFHHLDGNDKTGEIGNLVVYSSIDRLKREIEKCVVLCANCHAEHHWKEIYEYDEDDR